MIKVFAKGRSKSRLGHVSVLDRVKKLMNDFSHENLMLLHSIAFLIIHL